MTENIRTITYVGVGIVLLLVAAVVNRKPAIESEDAAVTKVLFPELKSPGDVNGLEIITLDQADNRPKVFKVIRDASGWSLPSHGNYPADAEKQVASAAASLIDLRVLGVVSKLPSEHAQYGVVAPDPDKAPPGAEGVGKLITVLDKSGKSLARLVIGKEDKRTSDDVGGQELRFVRALPHDPVYRVSFPSTKFTTNFADWIETDLLKLDPWDITEVTLKDYSIEVDANPATGQIAVDHQQKSTMKLNFNDKDAKWSLAELLEFKDGEAKPVELAEDEELNTTRLNEMKTALDDLKIVDVRRKPAGMSGNLKKEKSIFTDPQAMQSLITRGFYPVPGRSESAEPEILSNDGEVLVRMKDGVEYVLRFGEVAGIGSEEKKEEDKSGDTKGKKSTKEEKDETDKDKGTNLNRFIMVSARFNKDLIAKPELAPLPEAGSQSDKQDDAKPDQGAKDAASPQTKEPNTKSKDEPGNKGKANGGEQKSKQKAKQPKTPPPDDQSASGDSGFQFVKLQDESKKAAGKSSNAADAKSKKSGDPKSQENKAQSSKPSDAAKKSIDSKQEAKSAQSEKTKANQKANDSKAKAEGGKAEDSEKGNAKKADEFDTQPAQKKPSAEEQEELALERKRIEKENERKQKEYDEKVKKGESRARELNSRFADWYYVVSETTYRKIHLNRDDVIKTKADAKKTDADGDAKSNGAEGVDALKIPPLKADPFKKRDETKKDNDEGNDQ